MGAREQAAGAPGRGGRRGRGGDHALARGARTVALTRAYVALGSNLGDRARAIEQAIAMLGEDVLARSSLYETEPVGGPPDQPPYLNAVAELETTLEPRALLERCLEIERALGRDRSAEARWGPRTIDLDLLLHGDAVIDEPGLRIPHPRMHERAFVLVPLAELAPDLDIPARGTVRVLLEGLDGSGVRAV